MENDKKYNYFRMSSGWCGYIRRSLYIGVHLKKNNHILTDDLDIFFTIFGIFFIKINTSTFRFQEKKETSRSKGKNYVLGYWIKDRRIIAA